MRYIVLNKRQAITFASMVLVLTIGILTSLSVFADSRRQLPIYCVETDKKQIAISFDAAWGADDTDTLIEILGEYDVKATFFLVGGWVDKYSDEVKKLSDAGHSIQNHSNSHPYFTKISQEEMIKEIKSCNEKIKKIIGKEPILMRPPYGDYNNEVVEVTRKLGMWPIQWSIDSLDWQDTATVDSIIERVVKKAENGGIILCHNDADNTPKALPTILKTLKDEGYEFVLIEDLIYKDSYNIDHTGKQLK